MESKEVLFKPMELWNNSLSNKYHTASEQYFDKLAKDANIDKAQNALLVKKYNEADKELDFQKKALDKIKSKKAGRTALTVLAFIFGSIALLIGIIGIALNPLNLDSGLHIGLNIGLIVGGLALIGLGIFNLVTANKKFAPLISEQQKKIMSAQEAKDKALEECNKSMAALNELFDWNIPATVMERCTPIIDLDPVFTSERYLYLKEKFGVDILSDENTSLVGITSGNIQGNPFILGKFFSSTFGPKCYEGTLEISWVTTHYDSKGRMYTQVHHQTLHASVYHDAPFYSTTTKLIYGNDAAPHLSFTRSPTKGINLTGKARDKFINERMKELHQKEDKAIKKGTSFTVTDNDEFDAFFGGNDRDNEVEYRLLFTPLGMKNELDLLSKSPYGDDFTFYKRKKVNVIVSSHSQSFDYSANPTKFVHYDFEVAKNNFINYCDEYIKHLYFDLAPLISIPLYQMHKTLDYIYDRKVTSNVSYPEHEVMANGFDDECFRPEGASSSLPLLLKTSFLNKEGELDNVNVHAYSYITTPRTDYVSVLGRDGHHHNVPVHWTEYTRVDSDNKIQVMTTKSNRHEYRSELASKIIDLLSLAKDRARFERGLFSIYRENGYSKENNEKITTIFKKK